MIALISSCTKKVVLPDAACISAHYGHLLTAPRRAQSCSIVQDHLLRRTRQTHHPHAHLLCRRVVQRRLPVAVLALPPPQAGARGKEGGGACTGVADKWLPAHGCRVWLVMMHIMLPPLRAGSAGVLIAEQAHVEGMYILPLTCEQVVEGEQPAGGQSVADAAFAATHIGGATSCLGQPTWGAEAGAPASPEEERMTGPGGQRSDGVPVHRARGSVQRASPQMAIGLARLSSGAAKIRAAEGVFGGAAVGENTQAGEGMPATPPGAHMDRAASGLNGS